MQTNTEHVADNSGILNAFLMSGETHFHPTSYTYKQHFQYWNPNNPCRL